MNRLPLVLSVVLLAIPACASAPPPEAKDPPASLAPCAPEDCPPCDLTKSKCTGPSVCDGHPDKAKRVCARNAAGACVASLVCE